MSKKRHARGVIGNRHRVSREEAMKWFQQKVGDAYQEVEDGGKDGRFFYL